MILRTARRRRAKTTLNLARPERKSRKPGVWAAGVGAVLVAASLFGRFGVANRYVMVAQARIRLGETKQELDLLRAACANEASLREQYARYRVPEEELLPDRLEVLNLIDRELADVCIPEQISVTGSLLSVTMTGPDLSRLSDLLRRLEKEPMIRSVQAAVLEEDPDNGPRTALQIELEAPE